ncbi:hypothetical protein BH23ACT5_BH23ACT5_22110 [soil metagenome]
MILHADAGPAHLAVLRITVFAMWLGLIATTDTSLYPGLPATMIEPRGVTGFLPWEAILGSPVLVSGLHVAAIVGCVACILGVRPYRPIAGITFALILFHDAAAKSLGTYTNHAQLALLFLAGSLVLFSAADRYGIGLRRRQAGAEDVWSYRTPMILAAVIVALTYSFIGARRLFYGGLTVFSDDSLATWAVARTLQYSSFELDGGMRLLEWPALLPLLGIGMAVTTIFECMSPLAIRYQRYRWAWMIVIVCFHLMTLATMNILFWENLVLLAVLFTRLPDVVIRAIDRVSGVDASPRARGRSLASE